ncbi:MAG TPA: alpha-isopropylmalate synthase regulatory domain-containing protein, partial [Bacillota bacterium]|nr:alpha-isopropylmalate synthase regulatory domain-containing protein [Bacillota bacterium]
VHGTINGFGERCGNANLSSIIPNLKLKMGCQLSAGENLHQLTQLSNYFYEIANLIPNDYQPFVGKAAFAHKGGVHVSALRKNPGTYEHIEPEVVGNRRRVLVSELSGIASLSYKAEEYGIEGERDMFAPILDTVKNLEYKGYSFEGAEASFELLLKRSLGLVPEFFSLKGLRMIIEKNGNGSFVAEATVKIQVGDKVYHTVSEGDGPVNALDRALRLALRDVYPEIENISLTDYKVRVLDQKSATAASVRVLIESSGFGASWGTVGVSPNIIEASWNALFDSIVYGLYKSREV